jgi:RNA polymerase sigma-70 factor (ECF subfamily)
MDMEQEIVIQAKSGSSSAFNQLVSLYSRKVYSFVYLNVRNPDDSMDLTQDVFLRFWNNLDRFDEKRPVYPWLRRIALNLCINRGKRKSGKEAGFPEHFEATSPYETAEESLLDNEKRDAVLNALEQLPDHFREILRLKHFENCSYDEMAVILEIPVGTVMSRLFNARQKLKELLKEIPV